MNRAEEFAAKLKRVRDYLQREEASGLLLRSRSNLAWLGSGPDDGTPFEHVQGSRSEVWWQSDTGVLAFVVTANVVVLVAENIELPRLTRDEFAGLPIEVLVQPWHESDLATALADVLDDGGVVLTDLAEVTLAEKCACLELELRDDREKIAGLRASLLPRELSRYRWLGLHTAEVMTEVCKQIKPGMREVEVVAESHFRLRRLGIGQEVDIVCADDRLQVDRHALYGDRQIDRVAMVVFCAHKWGLVANLTRMVYIGEVPEALASRHAELINLDDGLMRASRPGTALRDIFTGVIEPGYAAIGASGEWRNHHQGGSTGYSGRDQRVTPTTVGTVQPNQAFAWNPSLPGLKTEDTFVALMDGPEILTTDSFWPVYEESGRARILSL